MPAIAKLMTKLKQFACDSRILVVDEVARLRSDVVGNLYESFVRNCYRGSILPVCFRIGCHGILLAASVAAWGQTCTTSTCTAASTSTADFLAALPSPSNANATVVVNIPSGTSSWSTAISGYTIPTAVTDLTIQGNTTVACTGTPGTSGFACTPTDNTIIQDAVTSNIPILGIVTGVSSTHFTLKGITFRGGNITSSSNNKYNGVIAFSGNTTNFRMTQVHIDNSTYTPAGTQSSWVRFNGPIAGVMDNNYWNLCTNSACIGVSTNGFQAFNTIGDSIGLGDGTWGNATPWGTANAIFAETSYFKGGYTDDCTFAGFFVIRDSTLEDVSVTAQTHATKSQGGPERGCRGYEEYNNYSKQSTATFAFSGSKGGPALVWGNTAQSGSWNWVYAACTDRQCNTGTETNTPNGWGYCGTSALIPPGPTTNGVGSAWDRNNPSSGVGYPCLDGVGRGQTQQLLNGKAFNAVVANGRLNSTTGTIAWPSQYLEPVYLWNNTITGAGGGFLNSGDLSTTNNRDIYYDCNALNSSCSGGFTGAFGTGFGLHSARPATCTAGPGSTNGASPTGSYGVGYWETDTSTFFVCTATNIWTAIYQPYVYPHPLVSGTGVTLTITTSGVGNVTGTDCASGTYASGTVIGPCTATGSGGSTFSAWSGVSGDAACSGSTNPCPSFTITTNSAFTATFTGGGGTAATPVWTPGTGSYPYAAPITLATATAGCTPYIWWSGNNPPTTANSYNTQALSNYVATTLYAKVIGCPGYSDSAVATATFSISGTPIPTTVLQISANAPITTGTTGAQ